MSNLAIAKPRIVIREPESIYQIDGEMSNGTWQTATESLSSGRPKLLEEEKHFYLLRAMPNCFWLKFHQ